MPSVAEHVVILHGLALNKYWMTGLAFSLKRQGYIVHNVSYPTRKLTFDQILEEHLAPLIQSITAPKIHFVVHSMGGLLVRLYAQKYGAERLHRVVMLGTPNRGSEVVDYLSSWKFLRLLFSGAAYELGTGPQGIAARLGPVSFACGIIAGSNRWFHFPANCLIKKLTAPHDGLVTVASTRMDGMKDHLVLWLDHSLMVWSPEVWRQTACFLRNGVFHR